eukprot:7386518-Prymnesium_polylepis.2
MAIGCCTLGVPRMAGAPDEYNAYGGEAERWLLRAASSIGELHHFELHCERDGGNGLTGGGLARVYRARVEASAPAAAVRDVMWATDTTSLCWGALALQTAADVALSPAELSVGQGGSPIVSVDRSHEGEVLVAADARGGVSLWRWPAALPSSVCNRAKGHAALPAAVRFSHDDSRVLSAGEGDVALLQWRATADGGPVEALGEGDSDLEGDLRPLAAYRAPKARGHEVGAAI